MKTRHWLFVSATSALLLFSLLVWMAPSAGRPTTRDSRARSLVVDAMGAAAPCVFEEGDELAYDLRVEVERRLRGPLAARGQEKPVETSMAAELHARVLEAGQGEALLLARYAHVERDGATAVIAAPFLLRVASSCRLAGFARHGETPAQAGRVQQALAHELNFVAAAPNAVATLEADDSLGHYRATFAARDTGSEAVIERRSLSYASLWEARDAPAPVTPELGQAQVVLGKGPWLEQLSSRSIVRGTGSADLDTRVEVSRIEADASVLEGADPDVRKYVWENLLPRLTFPRADRPVTQRDLAARAAVREQPVEEAVAAHVARSREIANFAEIWPPLTTYLEARPEHTKVVVEALRTGLVPPEGRAAGWVAVGQARTAEARTELLAVLHDPQAVVINRTRAMFALVDRNDVGAELTAELATYAMAISSAPDEDARFFAGEAALAMGMMAGLRRETDADVRATALLAVPRLLAAQRTPEALRPVFGAIANLGDVATVPMVEPYTRHANPKVRAGAARAFRRMVSTEVGSVLVPWLSRETDSDVKRELYLTLGKAVHDHLQQTPGAAVDRALVDRAIVDLRAHPGVITRRALIKILGTAARQYEPARQALMAQAKTETKLRSGLYALITRYLGADDLLAGLNQDVEAP